MPYKVMRIRGKYRLTKDGRIAKNKAGTSLDGGGSEDKSRVERQNRAIMASENRRRR